MAHMVETMAYAGELPWHGLGVPVSNDLTPDQMLEAAQLDWEVELRDLFYEHDDRFVMAKTKRVLIRSSDGKMLDVVGDGWNPLQNRDAFGFFQDFCMSGDVQMHTAGSLDEGRRVWALAKVNDGFELFGKDVVEQYLLFSNPHKYGQSIDVRMTPIRVVCHNTLSVALNQKRDDMMVRVNHRSVFDAETVKETLGIAAEKLAKYREVAEFLGAKRATDKDMLEYFTRVFGGSKVEGKLSKNQKLALVVKDTQPGAEMGAGTWWQAFNTVTYMTDHLMGRGADTRMKSAWFGANAGKKQHALEMAVEYAEAA